MTSGNTNQTAEQILWELYPDDVMDHNRRANCHLFLEQLRAHGLLSEGAPFDLHENHHHLPSREEYVMMTTPNPTAEQIAAEAERLIAECRHYNFGMRAADRLAHDIAPQLLQALRGVSYPSGGAFYEAAKAERATHERRGWTAEHDRKHGPGHPLRLALDYLANGKPVKAGALIYAALDVLSEGAPSEIQIERALDALSRFNQWTDNPRGAMRAALTAAGATPQTMIDEAALDGAPESAGLPVEGESK